MTPFPLALALRYLRSTRRDAFVSFLSLVATVGLALGVAALVLSLAALSGFHDVLLTEVRARTPDLVVRVPAGEAHSDLPDRLTELDEVEEAQWLAHADGWLIAGGRLRPVEVTGYGRRVPRSFQGAPGAADAAEAADAGVVVSDQTAALWGLEVGDTVEIASARPTLTPLGPQPRMVRLPVAGTFVSGRTEEEVRLLVPLARAAQLFGPEREVELSLVPGARAARVAERVRLTLEAEVEAGAEISTWREQNRALLFALRLEKSLIFVAVALIVVVAALALVADLALIVSRKRPEVGMLKAMGADRAQLLRAFFLLGTMLGGVGACLGGAMGWVAAWLLDRGEILSLSGRVYFIDYVPFQVRPGEVALILGLAVALACLGALSIAWRAAALDPIEALRR